MLSLNLRSSCMRAIPISIVETDQKSGPAKPRMLNYFSQLGSMTAGVQGLMIVQLVIRKVLAVQIRGISGQCTRRNICRHLTLND
jgi:spore maturation protein SpmA